MAIALIADAAAGGTSSTPSETAPIDTTGANFIVLVAGRTDTGITPTDNYSNTALALTGYNGIFGGSIGAWYIKNATTGSGHIFYFNDNSSALCVGAFSGVDPTSPFDVQDGISATNPPNGPSVTPSQNDSLIIAAAGIFEGFGGTAVPGSGVTSLNYVTGLGGTHWDCALAYEIQTTATTRSPTWTDTGSPGANASTVIAFKPATSGGTTWPGYQSPFGWR